MSSTWIESAGERKVYPSLAGDIRADVVVVGAGLTGATTAYLLSKAGKKVVLLEMSEKGDSSASAYTTGFITHDHDTSLSELSSMFGPEKAVRMWRSLEYAIDDIEDTIRDQRIDCEFTRCSYYTYARDDKEWEELEAEAKLAKHFGFQAKAQRDEALPFPNAGYMDLKDQAKFHAVKYIDGLLASADAAGASIFYGSKAESIEGEGATRTVRSKNGSVTTSAVVQATYYPFTDPTQLFAHTGRYITYIFEAAIRKGALPEALYQDEHNPYHYFRVDGEDGYDRLIAGGEDKRREVPIDDEKNFAALEMYMRERLPDITMDIKRRWCYTIIETMDGLPFIGPLKADPLQYVATGFAGTGMTISRVAAEIISDSILGKPNEWADLYVADRIPTAYSLVKKGKDYVGEFFGAAAKNMFKSASPRRE